MHSITNKIIRNGLETGLEKGRKRMLLNQTIMSLQAKK